MRKSQQRQIKIRDDDLQKLYAKLEATRSECNRIRQTMMFTEANVIGMEKLNELKGKLSEVQSEQKELLSEAKSLRSVKDEQFRQLE